MRSSRARSCAVVVILMLLAAACAKPRGSSGSSSGATQATRSGSENPAVEAAQLITPDTGWALTSVGLELTNDGGNTWQQVTPAGVDPASINAVAFQDTTNGWLGSVVSSPDGIAELRVYRTGDAGQSWTSTKLDSGQTYAESSVSSGSFALVDRNVAYYDFALASSSAAQTGVLFKTTDGGASWEKESLPVFGPLGFASADNGWVVSPNLGGQIFVTEDSGHSWQATTLASGSGSSQGPFASVPTLTTLQPSSDVVLTSSDSKGSPTTDVYSTKDAGKSWNLLASSTLGDANALVAGPASEIPQGAVLVASVNGQELGVFNRDGSVKQLNTSGVPPDVGLLGMSFADSANGWIVTEGGSCTDKSNCSESSALLVTTDGGASWSHLTPSASPAK